MPKIGVADLASYSNGSNGVLNSAYSAGTLTVHDGTMGTLSHTAGVGAVTGLALHA